MGQIKTLDQAYSVIPDIACQGKCHETCGVIPLFPAEAKDLESRGILPPQHSINGRCKSLTPENRCSIYERRPFICRIWGVTRTLACPFGCKPRRYLSDKECKKIGDAIKRLSDGQDPIVFAERPAIWK